MEIKIFYFSATGNSLVVARSIANEVGDTELVPIPQAMENHVDASESMLGLVFPVYAWGLPRIVADFVKQIKLRDSQYIFAVATCGGTPGGTLNQLRKMLRKNGADLAAGFVVKANSYHPAAESNPLITFVRNLDKNPTPKPAEERLPGITATIKSGQTHPPETSSFAANFVGRMFYPAALSSFQQTGKDYTVSDNCNTCRTCERVCPRKNISMVDGRPSWRDNCEMCFACLQWCPQKAIQYRGVTPNDGKRHNPQVTTKEMLLR
jgi:ferredoxin